jgi:acylphosphatase
VIENNIQIKLVITGRVQGVFFRASTKNEAAKTGVKGYVKNLADGSVQAVFQGDKLSVTKMIDWCHKGPAAARVDNILTQETEKISDFSGFEIQYG